MVTVQGKMITADGQLVTDAQVEFLLCGYGSISPKGIGTGGSVGTMAQISALAPMSGGNFTIVIVGNDVIVPAGTYYTITIRNGNGDVLQANAYIFLESVGAYNLDFTQPINPDFPPPPLPPPLTNEILDVPFSPTPIFDGSVLIAWQITLTADVTSSHASGCVPGNLYTFIIIQDGTGGHSFAWPDNSYNGTWVNPAPNSITIQTFVCDGSGNLAAAAPGTYYP